MVAKIVVDSQEKDFRARKISLYLYLAIASGSNITWCILLHAFTLNQFVRCVFDCHLLNICNTIESYRFVFDEEFCALQYVFI